MPMEHSEAELMELIRRNEEQLERDRREHPNLYSEWAKPYKVMDECGLHGIKLMRLRWLRENHPRETRLMERANVLEEHLENTVPRFRRRYAKALDDLMEARHLKNRADVIQAHPEITDQDRYYGLIQAQHDAEAIAIEEVVHAF